MNVVADMRTAAHRRLARLAVLVTLLLGSSVFVQPAAHADDGGFGDPTDPVRKRCAQEGATRNGEAELVPLPCREVNPPRDAETETRGDGDFAPPRPAPPARNVAEQAMSDLALPRPVLRHAPDDPTWVGVETWLWVTSGSWRTVRSSASVRGVRVDVTARPSRVVWRMGERLADGSQGSTVCKGPGRVWPRGSMDESLRTYCSYEYRTTSAGQPNERYTISATTVWTVSWVCSGRCDETSASSTRTTSGSELLRVGERQAVVDG